MYWHFFLFFWHISRLFFLGGGVMREWERQILFCYETVSPHTLRRILQTFIVNRNDPGTRPDLCEAEGSMTSLPFFPLFLHSAALALETRSARGYTHVLLATPSVDSINECVCVCVCVSRPLTTLHCNHHTQLPPDSLCSSHSLLPSLSDPLPRYYWYDLNSGS